MGIAKISKTLPMTITIFISGTDFSIIFNKTLLGDALFIFIQNQPA